MTEALVNKLGHRIGARGSRTRTRLLAAVRTLVEARHLGDIRVADVASAAALSPSNFYTYFKQVDEAVLALCEETGEDCGRLAVHLDGDWSADRGFPAARALVTDMVALWTRHGALLRIEHQLADQGDARFADCRIRRLRRLHLALERRIAQARAQGLHPEGLNPRLASYEVASLMESVGAGFQLMQRAEGPEAILDTTAWIVLLLVTGR